MTVYAQGAPGIRFRRDNFPFAVIPHPISNNADPELRTKAAEAVRQCVAILTGSLITSA
jgi:hypothetical protein